MGGTRDGTKYFITITRAATLFMYASRLLVHACTSVYHVFLIDSFGRKIERGVFHFSGSRLKFKNMFPFKELRTSEEMSPPLLLVFLPWVLVGWVHVLAWCFVCKTGTNNVGVYI